MQTVQHGEDPDGGDAGRPAASVTGAASPGDKVLMSLIRRRKPAVAADQAAAPVTAPRLTPERGIATAIARAAQQMFGLPVLARSIRVEHVTLGDLPELIPERALISLVEGAAEALGCVTLDPDLTAALIEQQTMGRLTSGGIGPRRATRTDAAMCADYISGTLQAIAVALAPLPDGGWAAGYRYSTWLDDPRPLDLMLEDVVYRLVRAELRLGLSGDRSGAIMIALPEVEAPSQQALSQQAATQQVLAQQASTGTGLADAPAVQLGQQIRAAVAQAPISLNAVLCRRKVPFALLRRLVPGDVIPLGSELLNGARLETQSGQVIAEGRLGEREGCHALRLRAVGTATGAEVTGATTGAEAAGAKAAGAGTGVASGVPDLRAARDETTQGPGPSFVGHDAAYEAEMAPPPAHLQTGRSLGAKGATGGAQIEPPIADLALRDPFRAPFRDDANAEDEPVPAPVLPMNLSVG
ncbi:flagellar motor switch protein FliM [Paracoccus pacificus]|uniref:FliM/FliN family flagellar motor C-terminal domain-containing protein n=1 Tax=Paracoccus pacificus TaxID=1463598 RepID=A0ABW4R9I2_9RHOB